MRLMEHCQREWRALYDFIFTDKYDDGEEKFTTDSDEDCEEEECTSDEEEDSESILSVG